MTLTCPKCQGSMRSYERSGVTVDQCADCRGLFLDRGELERLVDAEQTWHQPAQASPPRHDAGRDQFGTQAGYGYGHRPHKKRKSFLSELFDD